MCCLLFIVWCLLFGVCQCYKLSGRQVLGLVTIGGPMVTTPRILGFGSRYHWCPNGKQKQDTGFGSRYHWWPNGNNSQDTAWQQIIKLSRARPWGWLRPRTLGEHLFFDPVTIGGPMVKTPRTPDFVSRYHWWPNGKNSQDVRCWVSLPLVAQW